MAQLAVAGAGALASSAMGFGWQAGWLVGAAVGGVLFPQRGADQEGPRVTDLSVTSSGYGQVIPIGYGTVRMGGNIIWAKEIRERRSSQRVGKGGGQRQIAYSYYGSWAVAFAAGPAQTLIRLWGDSKLIYDATSQDAVEVRGACLQWYQGDEYQLPDPTIEADVGAGDAPGHRGLAYVVIEDLPLEDFGNRLPSITAEIAFAANDGIDHVDSELLGAVEGPASGQVGVDWERGRVFTARRSSGIRRLRLRDMVEVDAATPQQILGTDDNLGQRVGPVVLRSGYLIHAYGGSNRPPIALIDPLSLRMVDSFGSTSFSTSNSPSGFGFFDKATAASVLGRSGWLDFHLSLGGTRARNLGILFIGNRPPSGFGLHYLWHFNSGPGRGAAFLQGAQREGETDLWYVASFASQGRVQFYRGTINGELARLGLPGGVSGLDLDGPPVGEFLAGDLLPGAEGVSPQSGNVGTNARGFMYAVRDDALVFWYQLDDAAGARRRFIVKWSERGGIEWSHELQSNRSPGTRSIGSNSRLDGPEVTFVLGSSSTQGAITLRLSDGAVMRDYAGDETPGGADDMIFDWRSRSGVTTQGAGRRLFFGRAQSGAVGLAEVVADLCARGGLSGQDIDVQELEGRDVRGYTVGRQVSARQALEPLAQAFMFDAVESDGRLVFRKRGAEPVIEIDGAELLAADAETGDVFVQRRAQEVELPERVTVVHMDPGAEYEQGAQFAKRISAPLPAMYSLDQKTFEVPLVLDAPEAKTLAHRILFGAWVERDSFEFALGSEHAALEPTDVVEIAVDGADPVLVRLTQVAFGADFSMRLRGMRELPSVYRIEATADGGQGHRPRSIERAPATALIPLELPLLRARDDTGREAVRRYFMMGGFQDGWPGGSLYRVRDGEDAFVLRSRAIATWGSLAVPPANPRSIWSRQFDGEFEVALAAGGEDLASVSWAELFSGANAAALVNADGEVELLQFREVEVLGDQRYRLRGLLRGRRGTDPYVGAHGVGAQFVLLDAAIVTHELPLDRVGETVRWRAVGIGQAAEDADLVTQEVRALDLKPWAPARLRAERLPNDAIDISWMRRSRFNGDWRNATGEVPLNEDAELYRVELGVPGEEPARVIEVAEAQLLYEDFEADFGAAFPDAEALLVRVAQVSGQVGAGFYAQAVVPITVIEFGASALFDFSEPLAFLLSGQAMKIELPSSNGRLGVILSEVDATEDMEVLALVTQAGGRTLQRFGTALRASGETGDESVLAAYQNRSQRLQFGKYEDGAFKEQANTSDWDDAASRRVWIRHRCEGSEHYVRWWYPETPEPSEWLFQAAIGSVGPGRPGLFAFDGGSLQFCEYFAAGVGGASAPGPDETPGPDQHQVTFENGQADVDRFALWWNPSGVSRELISDPDVERGPARNWSSIWDMDGSLTYSSGPYMRFFSSSGNARSGAAYFGMGRLGDCEIYAELRTDQDRQNHTRIYARMGELDGDEWGVFIEFFEDDRFQLLVYEAGSSTTIDQADFPISLDTWYCMRLRVQGDYAQGRVWLAGADEPAAWQVSGSIPQIPAGWPGVGNFRGNSRIDYRVFEVREIIA